MIENIVTNRESFPDVQVGDQVTWLMPIAPELETRVWPVSLAVTSTSTVLPSLVLANENYNWSVPNEHISQPQKLLFTTNAVILFPWLVSYRTIDISMNEATINFVNITSLKQTEEKLQQNQQRLESLNKDLTELVAEQTEQIRRLASEVLITEQKVQQSVSQLLHDELQQILVYIQLKMKALYQLFSPDEQALQDQIQELNEALDLAFTVTRQVAVDLRPPFLLNEDFMESLNWLARVIKKRYGLVVTLKGTLRPNWPEEEVSSFLFQTVRELLFNIVKHARVNQAQVEVSEANDRLSIIILDDGQGFDVAATMQQRSSLGLINIHRQVELLGGQFHIESQVGKGTRATVVVLL